MTILAGITALAVGELSAVRILMTVRARSVRNRISCLAGLVAFCACDVDVFSEQRVVGLAVIEVEIRNLTKS